MEHNEQLSLKHEYLLKQLHQMQLDDGSYQFCFESGAMTDAHMLLLLYVFKEDKPLQVMLSRRLIRTQSVDGFWKQYHDDDGHLSSTVEAYTALYLSGFLEKNDPRLQSAASYIRKHGGLEKAHLSTKALLAIHHLYPWPAFFPLPLFLLKTPSWLPFSFYRLSSYVRTHFASLLILGHKKYAVKQEQDRNLIHLYKTKKYKKVLKQKPPNLPSASSDKLFQTAEHYLLDHIEDDGTLHSYASATFLMVYAFLSLGYPKNNPVIQQAISGLKSHLFQDEEKQEVHLQNSPSAVWDTALLTHAMQQRAPSASMDSIERSADFILKHQQTSGGWGFSASNSFHPDVDDTQVALRVLTPLVNTNVQVATAWRQGLHWLLQRQNNDGGWAAFEKNSSSYIPIPLQNAPDTIVDPSAPDLTGRTLEFLGTHAGLAQSHPTVKQAVQWLQTDQHENGSWLGRWGIAFIYGTWAAVTGMCAVGVSPEHRSLQKARHWLEQNCLADGGWGESCKSDVAKQFIPLHTSTVVHTAWALDALISLHQMPTEQMKKAVVCLLDWIDEEGIRTSYPTGGGLPGQFYIHYHSYRYCWPLLTISRYLNKYEKN